MCSRLRLGARRKLRVPQALLGSMLSCVKRPLLARLRHATGADDVR
jgi:hypothetical protein